MKIIEKVVEARTTGNKKCSDSCPILKSCKLQSPEVLLGKTISARERRQGMSTRGERDVVGILKIKLLRKRLMHIMLVVLATMAVTSVMVVMLKIAMTYLLTCQFTGT